MNRIDPLVQQPWNTLNISATDANAPALIDVKYNGDEEASITIDADGSSTSSLFKMTLSTGSNDYIIVGETADTGEDKACTTVGALVKAINALSDDVNGDHYGWHARRRNALADFSLASDDFADLAETEIGFDWTSVIHQDISTTTEMIGYRLCNPDYDSLDPEYLGRTLVSKGMVALGFLDFSVDYTTNGADMVVYDDDGNKLFAYTLTDDTQATTEDTGWFSTSSPYVARGPLFVGLEPSGALGAVTFDVARITWKPWNL